MEVAQESFAAMRQKRIDQMAKMHHQISSPKLREMLKEKCRIRIKESRQHLYDGRRPLGTAERRGFMERILKEEILEIETDIETQERIYLEIMEEAVQWMYEEMELFEENNIERLLGEDDNFCPICQKNNLLGHSDGIVECPCGVKLSYSPGPKSLHDNILMVASGHETACPARLQFFAEPSTHNQGMSSLNAYCASCEFFSTLVV